MSKRIAGTGVKTRETCPICAMNLGFVTPAALASHITSCIKTQEASYAKSARRQQQKKQHKSSDPASAAAAATKRKLPSRPSRTTTTGGASSPTKVRRKKKSCPLTASFSPPSSPPPAAVPRTVTCPLCSREFSLYKTAYDEVQRHVSMCSGKGGRKRSGDMKSDHETAEGDEGRGGGDGNNSSKRTNGGAASSSRKPPKPPLRPLPKLNWLISPPNPIAFDIVTACNFFAVEGVLECVSRGVINPPGPG
mmetsp:Transcript_20812/g.43416  ORF Transcript_20812/g.43416 Transcript_20812/m.43416 type:complete len:250 (+) Transcript_20812:111-860(+)